MGAQELTRGEVELASGEVDEKKERPLFVDARPRTQMQYRINLQGRVFEVTKYTQKKVPYNILKIR